MKFFIYILKNFFADNDILFLIFTVAILIFDMPLPVNIFLLSVALVWGICSIKLFTKK